MGLVTLVLCPQVHLVASGPQCTWHHTKQELWDILAELEKEIKPFSLECECIHIVRAFKMFSRPLMGGAHH